MVSMGSQHELSVWLVSMTGSWGCSTRLISVNSECEWLVLLTIHTDHSRWPSTLTNHINLSHWPPTLTRHADPSMFNLCQKLPLGPHWKTGNKMFSWNQRFYMKFHFFTFTDVLYTELIHLSWGLQPQLLPMNGKTT